MPTEPMPRIEVSEEEVEAAASALFESFHEFSGYKWSDCREDAKPDYYGYARTALQAAAAVRQARETTERP